MSCVKNIEDEIYKFEDMINIGPEEAFWKINELPMQKIYPLCQSIDVHFTEKIKSILIIKMMWWKL